MISTYLYSVYGLILRLPFPCQALIPVSSLLTPDITVDYGVVARELPNPSVGGGTLGCNWQAASGQFLLRGGRRVGRFLVEYGERITIEPTPEAEEERILYHLLHVVLAAVLRQRGLMVLHANAVITPMGDVVALAGESGAGKSTTLLALLECGYEMLSDDISVLYQRPDQIIEVLPGIASLHLCEDAAIGMGFNMEKLPRNPLRRTKKIVPVLQGIKEAAVLRTIYILKPYYGDVLRLRSMQGTDKFAALQECIYGPLLQKEHDEMFSLFSTVVNQTAIYYLERPIDRWTVPEVREVIQHG